MKPVFSNSSNMLKKGENAFVQPEQHFQFPYFVKNLPKTGLKNNLKEYKAVLRNYVKTDNKISKEQKPNIFSDFKHHLTGS